MDYENIECAIVSFTDDKHTNSLLKGLLDDKFSEEFTYNGNIKSITWNISNKYFDASVKLCCCNNNEFLENYKKFILLDAVVFLFDLNNVSGFAEVKNMSHFFEDSQPDVRLIWDASRCQLEEERRKDLFGWCIDHHFEFVENEDENGDEDDIDEGFCTKYGVDRIVEALSSHVWRNHRIKGESNGGANGHSHQTSMETQEEKMFEGGESFEELFGKFHIMKGQASGLAGDARKDYAEKVALAFMEAMGIDDDEEVNDEDR